MLLPSDAARSRHMAGLRPASRHSRGVRPSSQGEHLSAKLPASAWGACPAAAMMRGFQMSAQLSVLGRRSEKSRSCPPTPQAQGSRTGEPVCAPLSCAWVHVAVGKRDPPCMVAWGRRRPHPAGQSHSGHLLRAWHLPRWFFPVWFEGHGGSWPAAHATRHVPFPGRASLALPLPFWEARIRGVHPARHVVHPWLTTVSVWPV